MEESTARIHRANIARWAELTVPRTWKACRLKRGRGIPWFARATKAGRNEVRPYSAELRRMKSWRAGAQYIAPLQRKKLGAEEDGFALEHFDGEEEGGRGVDAGRAEDDGDEVPVVSTGDEILAEQTDIENGNERKFGSEFNARQHGGDRRDDHDEHERCDVALGFFMAFGKQRDGKERGGKHYGEWQRHEENGKNCADADVELRRTGIGTAAGIESVKFLGSPEGNAHGSDREGGGDQSGGQNEKKLPEHEMHAGNRAGENRFHGAAFFFPGGEIDGRIHGALEAQDNDEIAEESADGGSANFFGRGHVFLFDFEWIENRDGKISGCKTVLDDVIAVLLQRFFHVVGSELRFDLVLVVVNFYGTGFLPGEAGLETIRNFHRRANLFIDNAILPVGSRVHELKAVELFQIRQHMG